jgi:alcohol dehydrogenase (NADP+)
MSLREDIMRHSNEETETGRSTAGHSRRDFIASAATVAAAAGAAQLLRAAAAGAASAPDAAAVGRGPYPTVGMAAYSPTGPHQRMNFERRALGPRDVAIEIDFAGVCHSDIHTIRGDWGKIQYPQIVGHEVAGRVAAVGARVSKFDVGARVGVGTMVDSCRTCEECQAGHENYCLNGNTQTYGSKDKDGTITQGGYSTFIVVDEDFVISIPPAIDLAEAGPLLCAGITVYSPLRRWGIGGGKKVAVVGMGGLGHLAVKFATVLGGEVTVFTTSPEKVEDAKRFGAREVIINQDGADFSRLRHAFDFALDTVPYKHDLNRFIPILKRDATFCRVGVGKVTDSNEVGQMNLVLYRNAIAGSNTGGIQETQDMIEFCAKNQIKPEVTRISMNAIDDAWKQVLDKKARYRFVIDMSSMTRG